MTKLVDADVIRCERAIASAFEAHVQHLYNVMVLAKISTQADDMGPVNRFRSGLDVAVAARIEALQSLEK